MAEPLAPRPRNWMPALVIAAILVVMLALYSLSEHQADKNTSQFIDNLCATTPDC